MAKGPLLGRYRKKTQDAISGVERCEDTVAQSGQGAVTCLEFWQFTGGAGPEATAGVELKPGTKQMLPVLQPLSWFTVADGNFPLSTLLHLHTVIHIPVWSTER